ncbi:MAG: ROK family transcriptional regulator [Gammaproteobacteria bacterium]|nr:ROK family transcriptional regulator [Gammaproteobacteria bacterium]MBV8308258.1 ROK family transcriptional regulator [Gammaproteobacteria bacterium]MBV8405804.1 ROK family transcriptional regulator [Gammaproteobacteria bacterium]
MVSRGTTQQSSAPFNRRIVLDVIRRQGRISRREIVELVSLSPQTVANITNELQTIGLIVARRIRGAKARGQPPIAFELNPNAGNSLGISLEPGRISAGLVNLVGEILERREVAIDTHDQRVVLASVVALIRELRRRPAAAERLWGIGVALPGPLVKTDISFVGPTTLEGWTDLAVLDELRDLTRLQVFYSVDSVAAALGETLFGVARSLDNFFYMHFGVGLGGTLVVNRSAYRGASGNATEIGHIPAVPGGKSCYCGNSGCLERYLSLQSLAEALGVSEAPQRDALIVAQLERNDDPALKGWCREAAERLRDAVCVIENMLDPATIVIGGSAPKLLVERLVALAQPLHHSVRGGVAAPTVRILLSERQEDSSILGAAVLPIYDLLSPRFEVLQQERRADADVAGLMGQRAASRAGRL